MKNGKVITDYSSTHIYRVAGAPAKLNIHDELIKIYKSSNPHIKQYIGYLAKAIIFYQKGFPDHSIIEAYKIVEPDETFIHYNMYFALRNILAHSPYYKKKTRRYFKESFNKDNFDYLKYDPDNKLIVLDLDSNKTLRKLNKIVVELISHLKIYLDLE